MQEHSDYSPSSLSRIIRCPGSVNLINNLIITKTIPKEQRSSYAAHGSMLHDVLHRYNWMQESLNGLDTDDKFLIEECMDYLKVLTISKGHNNLYIKSETKVDLRQWGLQDVWGTLDYQITDPIKRHIDVIDWKFGAGVQVYAYKNPQLLAYAAGVISWPTTIQTITLHVVQPAIENFDTYDLTIEELYDWVHGTLAIAIGKCSSENAKCNPGVEQCRWCSAKNHCSDRMDFVQEAAIKLFDAQTSLATVPTIEKLTDLLKKAPAVEKAIKDIRTYVTNELQKGKLIPGYKLVHGRSNRKWVDETKAVEWLEKNTKLDELFISKLQSPAQLEKQLKLLKKNEEFQKLFHNPLGKITLVVDTDKRPAIEDVSHDPIDVFKDYQTGELEHLDAGKEN